MLDSIAHSTLKLCADDSSLFHPITSPDDLTKLQSDLDGLVDWADNAQMKFNKSAVARFARNNILVAQ